MALELVTPPSADLLSLAEAKAHLTVEHTDDDAYIAALVRGVSRDIANRTNRALVTSTWRLWLDRFPRGTVIELPNPPLQSVTHLKYRDQSDVLQTWSSDNYIVDAVSAPGRLSLTRVSLWPALGRDVNAVQVEFVAGYGAPAAVPETYKDAARLLLGYRYAAREAVVIGAIATVLPEAVDALLRGESWGGWYRE